jgi:hypothetical protein
MVDPEIAPFYTDAELREIEAGCVEYDRIAAEQLAADKEYAERPFKKHDYRKELDEEIEQFNIEYLQYLAMDIGLLNKIREQWPDNPEIQEYAKYIIILEHEQMKEISEELENGRSKNQ